jgi:hypothetical protein
MPSPKADLVPSYVYLTGTMGGAIKVRNRSGSRIARASANARATKSSLFLGDGDTLPHLR